MPAPKRIMSVFALLGLLALSPATPRVWAAENDPTILAAVDSAIAAINAGSVTDAKAGPRGLWTGYHGRLAAVGQGAGRPCLRVRRLTGVDRGAYAFLSGNNGEGSDPSGAGKEEI